MKKIFKFYIIIWAVLLALFNVISFVSVGWAGVEKYTTSFWIGYVFIMLAFISQIICSYFALKNNDIKKTFYNISLITTSYTGLILSFVFGGLCMIISPIPYWIGIILCAIVLTLNIIAVVKASAAITLVNSIDEKIEIKTHFIKSLTIDVENLMSQARDETAKAKCKEVYEAVRYSDPMSKGALASIENEILLKFIELSEAIANDESELYSKMSDDIIILLGERNRKCKLLK